MVTIEVGYNPAKDASLHETVRINTPATTGSMHFSWQDHLPMLVLTGDTPDFDPTTIAHWQDEGFAVSYINYDGDKAKYMNKLQHLADPLELGDKYAIVAYGSAATLCIEACLKPMPKLCALVAYYPPYMPNTNTTFPPSLHAQVHLAGSQNFGTRYPSFKYPDTVPGFAEEDLPEYDKVGARLAWSRVLGLIRKGFNKTVDLEKIWDNHLALEFVDKDAEATMKTMVAQPYVNHVPTMTGGIGYRDLKRFYADFFIPNNPPDTKSKLLSRTVGTDRIVDEMLFSFTHTMEVPWLLPGVPATGKKLEFIVVSVVSIRGTKLYHEHIHWDQATVLMQVGLLDPKLVPKSFKTTEKGREKEVQRLPVVGAEGARKVVDEEQEYSNELIKNWK